MHPRRHIGSFPAGTLSRAILGVLLLAGGFTLQGCATVSWYGQLARGHAEILLARRDVGQVLADPGTRPELRDRIRYTRDVIEFAGNRLHLPAAGQYTHYADIGRPYALWALFAAPEFSMDPVEWCYPVAGCASYRGYFSPETARREARALESRGNDAWVGGIRAYSTLGWFSDPLLNTFIHDGDEALAALLFHELAHVRLYVPGDTPFNESLASVVEREGLRLWTRHLGRPEAYTAYLETRRLQDLFSGLVESAVARLERLYGTDADLESLRRDKRAIIEDLRARYRDATTREPGLARYADWFTGPINNARLGTVRTYNRWVPALERLLRDSGGDFAAFFTRCEALAALNKEARQAQLEALGKVSRGSENRRETASLSSRGRSSAGAAQNRALTAKTLQNL